MPFGSSGESRAIGQPQRMRDRPARLLHAGRGQCRENRSRRPRHRCSARSSGSARIHRDQSAIARGHARALLGRASRRCSCVPPATSTASTVSARAGNESELHRARCLHLAFLHRSPSSERSMPRALPSRPCSASDTSDIEERQQLVPSVDDVDLCARAPRTCSHIRCRSPPRRSRLASSESGARFRIVSES